MTREAAFRGHGLAMVTGDEHVNRRDNKKGEEGSTAMPPTSTRPIELRAAALAPETSVRGK